MEKKISNENIRDFEGKILNRFADSKYKKKSLLEIYILDEQYFKNMIQQGRIDADVRSFFEIMGNEIRRMAVKHPFDGFGKLAYMQLIEDYMVGKENARNNIPGESNKKKKVIIIGKEYKCPKNHRMIQCYRMRGESGHTPVSVYRCNVCDALYIIDPRFRTHSIIQGKDGEDIRVIREWEYKAGPDVDGYKQISPYVYERSEEIDIPINTETVDKEPITCNYCNGKVCNVRFKYVDSRKTKLCIKCGRVYFIENKEKQIKKADPKRETKDYGSAYSAEDHRTPRREMSTPEKRQKYEPLPIYDVYVYYKLTNKCVTQHDEYVSAVTLLY